MARLNLLADLIDEGTAPAANQPVEQGDRPHIGRPAVCVDGQEALTSYPATRDDHANRRRACAG